MDTYDALKSGVPTAIKVAKELGNIINFIGIRLDSGDLAYLSKEARKLLDQAGFVEANIFASNDLDEYTIMSLKAQGAKIDAWGVGTKAITALDQPALGAVYKLVSIEDENGQMRDTIKISACPEKVTTPGYIGKFVTHFTAKDLHVDIFDHGTLVYESPQVQEIQSYAGQQLDLFWEECKRSLNPAEYPVCISQACWDNKTKNIEEVKKHNQKSVLL